MTHAVRRQETTNSWPFHCPIGSCEWCACIPESSFCSEHFSSEKGIQLQSKVVNWIPFSEETERYHSRNSGLALAFPCEMGIGMGNNLRIRAKSDTFPARALSVGPSIATRIRIHIKQIKQYQEQHPLPSKQKIMGPLGRLEPLLLDVVPHLSSPLGAASSDGVATAGLFTRRFFAVQ